MAKSTIYMAIFNSYVTNYQRVLFCRVSKTCCCFKHMLSIVIQDMLHVISNTCYPRYVKHVVTQTHVTVFVGFNRLTHGFPPRLIRAKRVPVAFWSLRRTSQAGNAPDGKCSTVSCQNCLWEATHQLHFVFGCVPTSTQVVTMEVALSIPAHPRNHVV